MKTTNLRIGSKGGPYIVIPISEPESVADWQKLHAGDSGLAYLIKCANRGRRIDIQEEGRDEVKEQMEKGTAADKVAEAIVAHLSTVDLTAKKARGTGTGKPRAPKTVTIKEMPTNLDDLKKLLAAQGVAVG